MSSLVPFLIYAAIFIVAFYLVKYVVHRSAKHDFASLKTVTFRNLAS